MKNLMFVLITLIITGISIDTIAQESYANADNDKITKMKSSKEAIAIDSKMHKKARKHNVKMKKMKMQRAKGTKFMSHPQINARPATKAVQQKIKKDKIDKLRKSAE